MLAVAIGQVMVVRVCGNAEVAVQSICDMDMPPTSNHRLRDERGREEDR